MSPARVKIMGAGLAVVLPVLLYSFFNPADYSFFPKCPFYSLTGLYCPGCGSQRAFHALLHGHVLQAAGFNLLVVAVLPFLIYSAAVFAGNNIFHKRWRQTIFYKPWFAWAVLAFVLLFWLFRNLPLDCFRWMAP